MISIPFMKNTRAKPAPAVNPGTAKPGSLAQVRPGQTVTISGYGKIKPAHRQHLQAYGLLPGCVLLVLAQKPVTVIQIEHTELAFETEIARQVLVEEKR